MNIDVRNHTARPALMALCLSVGAMFSVTTHAA